MASADWRARLRERAEALDGRVGIVVLHPRSGTRWSFNADGLFPSASLIKVPILVGLTERVRRGALAWRQRLPFGRERIYGGSDLTAALADGAEIGVAELAHAMCAASDNTASLWCQELAGTGHAINAIMVREGFEQTRVNSRVEGRESARSRMGWGQSTPREMARMMLAIQRGQLLDRPASEAMRRTLSRALWDDGMLSVLPRGLAAISKQGAVSDARSEVMVVEGERGPLAVCVMTADLADRSWRHDHPASELLRFVAGEALAALEGAERPAPVPTRWR